jgi:hypothetical protein
LNLIELANGIYELSNFVAKILLDVGERRGSIFNNVVQNCGRYRLNVEVHLSEFLSNGDGMRDIRFAGLSRLPGMRVSAELVGARNLREVFFG